MRKLAKNPFPVPTMLRPEGAGPAPAVATLADIPAINALFSDAFTERYQRDGMVGVRVPPLHPGIWRYALEDAGAGALIWRDASGELAAFNIAHVSGTEGWMGPLAVRPAWQGHGLGAEIVRAGIRYLKERGVAVIGLETMPRTVENIGFYSGLGFLPGHLTISLTRPAGRRRVSGALRLSDHPAERARLITACRTLTAELAPGLDFTRELELTETLNLGGTTLIGATQAVHGFAAWHNAPLAADRPAEELRVLKLVARDEDTLDLLLDALEREALDRRLDRVTIRVQSVFGEAYAAMMARGYRVQWTDLRMTLSGYAERPVAPGAVVLSNWEI